jgi:hypothetical protein
MVGARGRGVLTAVPDRRRRLSDGLVVEASIVARLLGIRLLKLDATVVVVPADVTASSSAPHASPGLAPARVTLPDRRPDAAGGGLTEAVQRIDEGAAILAELRRTAPWNGVGRDEGLHRKA